MNPIFNSRIISILENNIAFKIKTPLEGTYNLIQEGEVANLKNLNTFKQKHSYDCGPASIKIVLDFYGIQTNYSTLVKNINRLGADKDDMIKMLEKHKLNGLYVEYSSLENIKKLINKNVPVIIAWFKKDSDGNGSHWSVVKGVTKKDISISDPAIGSILTIPLKEFEPCWFTINAEESTNINPLASSREIIIPIKET